MNEEPIDPFDDIPNSLLDATFRETRLRKDLIMPEKRKLNNLGTISGFYLYANPPPMAYGTPAPKIAETVLRALDFNVKNTNRTIKIGKYLIDNPVWENEGLFPFDQVASNWHPGEVHKMAKQFLKENFSSIVSTVDTVIEDAMTRNSDVLTQGKQTWDPILERSVPSAQAYSEMVDLMTDNGLPNHHTLLGFIVNIFKMMALSELKTKENEIIMIDKQVRINSQRIKVQKKSSKTVKKTIKGNSKVFDYIVDLVRSFCGYNKHGERAHLERRAISSPPMGFRAFQLIIEDFHLKLGKRIKGSTISIGGDEKKMKIINTMNSANIDAESIRTLQATQDATKWNECLSAGGFGMMSKTLFDNQVRKEMNLPEVTSNERLFNEICMAGHFFLSIKRIWLGNGLQGCSESFHGEIPICKENFEKFNEKTKMWVSKSIPLLEGNYLSASGGMLMGMHNAASTTMGLLSVGYKPIPGTGIYTLRSSDDSMTLYSASDMEGMNKVIDQENLNLKACGINMSKKKTFIFNYGYGEYTSWYQDGTMVSQYGPETTTLRPGGNNPPDDFNNLARTTSVSLIKLETNEIGAETKLRLGIENIRNLYRIKEQSRQEEGISDDCLVLSDGGKNPWDSSNCHLEETCIKERKAQSDKDREYFLRIRNPDNPFSSEPKEEISWSRDTGSLTMEYAETPRTIFHFVKRANRAITNIKGPTHAQSEKDHAEAVGILTMADISTLIKTPATPIKMSEHIISCIRTLSSTISLSDEEKFSIEQALKTLREGKANEEEEEGNLSDMEEL
uniref:RNA-directed RNA polymerase catalytic subunit n=1 Tax=Splett orthomyxo-like virus TaxID=2716749 RepID=A0A6G7PSK6_9ORTO|nr:PB1 [Splett orthomyxo-like virus]